MRIGSRHRRSQYCSVAALTAGLLTTAACLSCLIGCGSGTSNAAAGILPEAAPPLAAGGATSLYVIQQSAPGANSILQFSATANGSVAPLSTLTLPAALTPLFVTTDTVGRIYVGTTPAAGGAGQILVYAAGASGTAAALQTILGSATLGQGTFTSPNYLAVDSAGLLYVFDGGTSISVFAAGANGPATPIRQIVGALTQLTSGPGSTGIAVDQSGYIYVGDPAPSSSLTDDILVFSPGATGNVAPARVLNVGGSLAAIEGLDVDAAGNLYVAAAGAIGVFAPGATGRDQPVRTIQLPFTLTNPPTSGVTPNSIRVDAAGNIYAKCTLYPPTIAYTAVPAIASFGAGAMSPIAPLDPYDFTALTPTTTITSSAWTWGVFGLGLK
jgi:hypothetical protein